MSGKDQVTLAIILKHDIRDGYVSWIFMDQFIMRQLLILPFKRDVNFKKLILFYIANFYLRLNSDYVLNLKIRVI